MTNLDSRARRIFWRLLAGPLLLVICFLAIAGSGPNRLRTGISLTAVIGLGVFVTIELIQEIKGSKKKATRVKSARSPRVKSGPITTPKVPGANRSSNEMLYERFAPNQPSSRRMEEGGWEPKAPTLPSWEAWGPGRNLVKVVASENTREKLSGVLLPQDEPDGKPQELVAKAILVRDPNNPLDVEANATAVFISGVHVGYLPASISGKWRKPLDSLLIRGYHLVVSAQIKPATIGPNKTDFMVQLKMPDPNSLEPQNELPKVPFSILPIGPVRQVRGTEERAETLKHYLRDAEVGILAVTLRTAVEVRPRSQVETVHVDLDGRPVGWLTAHQSKKIVAILKPLEEQGDLIVARAELSRSKGRLDLKVRVPSANLDPGPSYRELKQSA